MKRKLLDITIGISLLLIIVTFNPFIYPGIYFDSTSAFTFLSLHKVILLGVLNFALLSVWLIRIFKTRELSLTTSKVYLPIFLFLISSIISTIFSVNRNNSLFGFNSTLSNSLIELSMLFVFFFNFTNLVRDRISIYRIIRFVNAAFALAVVWVLFRYATTISFNSFYINSYFNSEFFSPTGHYGSLIILVIAGFIMNLALIHDFYTRNTSKYVFIFDVIVSLLLGVGIINFFNYNEGFKLYFFIFAALASIGFILYLISDRKDLNKTFIAFLSITAASLILGIGSYYTLTRKVFTAVNYPPVPVTVDNTWDVTMKSFGTVQRGILGNGSGNYAYGFDLYKKPDLIPLNLRTNLNYPLSPEIRVNQSSSYIGEVFFSNGVIGLISFLAILFVLIKKSYEKYSGDFDLNGTMFLIAFCVVASSILFVGYDFSLILLLWILISVNIIFVNENVPQKKLDLSLVGMSPSIDKRNNYSFIIPLIFLTVTGTVLFLGFKLISANTYMFKAKQAQSDNNKAEYVRLAEKAVMSYSKSDVFGRELLNARGVSFVEGTLQVLQKELVDKPELKDNEEFKNKVNQASAIKDQILGAFSYNLALYPQDYKNYYSAGIFLFDTSSYTNLSSDTASVEYFQNSILRNPHHPESNYYMALLFERNERFDVAFGYIEEAARYDPSNISYKVKYADLLAENKRFDEALRYYEDFKSLKDNNPDNQYIQNVYKSFAIDSRIEQTKKEKEKQGSSSDGKTTTPTVTPTPQSSPTVTPTPKN